MPPPLYVMRHGETAWNRAGRMQGALDSPLTALGRAQAVAMGRALARAGVGAGGYDALCSPQARALDTARLALAPTGLQAAPDPRLREIGMGEWAGLDRDEIARRWPGPGGESFVDLYARAPGGEPFAALWTRVGAVLDGLTRPTVIVTHGMTSRFLRCRALGLGQDRIGTLDGGQGVIFEIRDGQSRRIDGIGLPQAPATGMAAP